MINKEQTRTLASFGREEYFRLPGALQTGRRNFPRCYGMTEITLS